MWQTHIERILAGWVGELAVPISRGREVRGFAQDDTGVALSDGQSLRAEYLVGCDGEHSLIRRLGLQYPTNSSPGWTCRCSGRFPQTHLMWRGVAPLLVRNFTVVYADLRGYGRSGCPVSTPDHAQYAKRAMARDMVIVMEQLGFPRFSVAGHDRGGRVAYRVALDHPDRVERLAVLDVLPTETVWGRADARFALAYWPWSLLAQPEPLPERILEAVPEAIIDDALGRWGSPPAVFPPEVRAAYVQALREPGHAHAICEEYRAAATIDREHDKADLASGRRIMCPLLALWSAQGPLDTWYVEEGGPIALWRAWGDDVRGHAVEA